MRTELFCTAVTENRRQPLLGDIVLVQLLAFRLLTMIALAIFIATLLFLAFTPQQQTQAFSGQLVISNAANTASDDDSNNREDTAVVDVPVRSLNTPPVGKAVQVSYQNFPSAEFGQYSGKVAGAGELLPLNDSSSGPVYRIPISLSAQQINAYNCLFALQEGMTLQAQVTLSEQPLLDWLLNDSSAKQVHGQPQEKDKGRG